MPSRRPLIAVVLSLSLFPCHSLFAFFSQQGPKLVGSGGIGRAYQGKSLSVSGDGNTAIAGGFNDNGGVGAAWVWTRSAGVWTQQGPKLVGLGAAGAALQGFSVAISGDGQTAIVGGAADSSNTGAAWVWTRTGGVWTQQGPKLVGTGAVGPASQGSAVALSADGNTTMIGGFDDSGGTGAAWIWVRSGGVWTQQGTKLVGSGTIGNANQGASVDLSADGNTAIVGGYGDNFGTGAVWVWTRSGGVWTQQGPKLVGSGASAVGSPVQGRSVSISADGNTAVVGGSGDDDYKGAAWIWIRSGGVWTQQGPKLVGTGAAPYTGPALVINSLQGYSVSLSGDGNTAIVGGPNDDRYVGAVWVWTRLGGLWTQSGPKLVGSGGEQSSLGSAVALSGDGNTAVAAGGDDDDMGAAWVFVAADLTIAKSHAGSFRQGDTGDTYTLTVTNSGAAATSGAVVVTDTLPDGLIPTGPNGVFGGWVCSIAGQTLTCTRNDVLVPGAAYPPITLIVDVPNTAGASVTNTATVSGGGEVNAANDAAGDVTAIAGSADMSITKSVNGGPPFAAGTNLTYTITVMNGGTGTASDVTVSDVIPTGTSFVSATPSQGSCTGVTTVTCALGTVLNGGSAAVSLTVATGSTPAAIANTATVAATQDDPNQSNNVSASPVINTVAAPIPATSNAALIVLAGLLAMFGALGIRAMHS